MNQSSASSGPFEEVAVETVKGYWDRRPCNIRHSQLEVGTREYFDEVEKRKYFVEPHIPAFAEFERWKDKRVLEIGCGIGTDTINFARAGARVTAVDLSTESLELAKRRAEVFGLSERITFVQANAEKLTEYVPVEEYDLVYSFGVIHHTPHPERVIENVKRYLAPDGVFKIMVYNKASWKVLWIILKYGMGRFWKADELIARYSEAQTGCPVTYSYTRNSVRGLLPGFSISETLIDHIFPYHIPSYVKHQYRKVWYFRILPDSLFRWFERRYGWHLCVEARLSDR